MKSPEHILPEIQLQIALGSEAALARLHELYCERLEIFARSLVRSREIAEELVEDIFVKLWGNRLKIQDIENLNIYLYVAVKNQSLNYLSRKAKEAVVQPFDHCSIELNDITSSPCDILITKEMSAGIRSAINELPPRCKMIFKLVREDGLRYKEVAEILNISTNTIEAQMAIAIKRICQALKIDRHSP
jgi:RNA polymerase sigma-70 factor (ECF subfamily)